MSKDFTSEQLDELYRPSTTTSEMRRRYEMADQMVSDLAHGRRRWTLCVPVREDDPDIVFSAALCDLRALIERWDSVPWDNIYQLAVDANTLAGTPLYGAEKVRLWVVDNAPPVDQAALDAELGRLMNVLTNINSSSRREHE